MTRLIVSAIACMVFTATATCADTYNAIFRENTVKIRYVYENSQCRGGDGFGIVVGWSQSEAVIAFPEHIIERKNGCEALEKVDVEFFGEDIDQVPEKSIVRISGLDLAFLVTRDPHSKTRRPLLMSDANDLSAGDSGFKYFGYDGKFVPSLPVGVVTAGCNEVSDPNCLVSFDNLGGRTGASGAPVFRSGRTIDGMILQGTRIITRMLSMAAIKLAADTHNVTWRIQNQNSEVETGNSFMDAVAKKEEETALYLLSESWFYLDKNYYSASHDIETHPLEYAAQNRLQETTNALIERGAQLGSTTAALIATELNWLDTLDLLIEKKLPLSCALAKAVMLKREPVIERLMEEVSKGSYTPNAICPDRPSALYAALASEQWDLAKELISNNANPNLGYPHGSNIKGSNLVLAILNGQEDLVDDLLRSDVDVFSMETLSANIPFSSQSSNSYFGPIHAAAYVGNLELVRRLIDFGVKPDLHVTVNPATGKQVEILSPIEAAYFGGQLEVAKMLYKEHSAGLLGYRRGTAYDIREDIRFHQLQLDASTRRTISKFIEDNFDIYCRSLRAVERTEIPLYYAATAKCSNF